jgi:hypothetical protein
MSMPSADATFASDAVRCKSMDAATTSTVAAARSMACDNTVNGYGMLLSTCWSGYNR